MFQVYGTSDLTGEDFHFFVFEEEEAIRRTNDLNAGSSVVFYEFDHDAARVLEIGAKVNKKLGDPKDFYSFLRILMDRLEGKEQFVNEMQFLVSYNQKLLEVRK